jgi:secretion/DNA translocation related TadE-like protein
MTRQSAARDRERGSATILTLTAVLLLLSLLTAFLLVAAALHGSQRARAAADAAALAGAGILLEGGTPTSACAAAAELARANGAKLLRCEEQYRGASHATSLRVEVAVQVPALRGAHAHAVAHAGAVPRSDEPGQHR